MLEIKTNLITAAVYRTIHTITILLISFNYIIGNLFSTTFKLLRTTLHMYLYSQLIHNTELISSERVAYAPHTIMKLQNKILDMEAV